MCVDGNFLEVGIIWINHVVLFLKFLSKECGCWKEILKMGSVVRGLIKKLDLALAKEVRIEVLADWG